MRRMVAIAALGVSGLAGVSCGDDKRVIPAPIKPSGDASWSFVGLYAIERITKTVGGCDKPVETTDREARCMAFWEEEFMGIMYLHGLAQPSMEECQKVAAGARPATRYFVSLDQGIHTASAIGTVGGSAFPVDGMCKDARVDALKLDRSGSDRIRLEIRTTKFSYPGNTLMECSTGESVKAVEGKPCSEVTVIEAKKHEGS
jgi:hypothetical protein